MALTPDQIKKIRLKVGAPAYDLFVATYTDTAVESIFTERNGMITWVAVDILEALASYASSVSEVKIGPIAVKLRAESYLRASRRLKRGLTESSTASYVIRVVGMP